MRSQALAWTAALFVLAALRAGAQDGAPPNDLMPGRAKGASGDASVMRDALLPPATPGRAKAAQFTNVRPPSSDLVHMLVGGTKEKEKQKEKGKEKAKESAPPFQPPAEPPANDIFANAAPVGSEAPEGLNPRMIGDLPGFFSLQRFLVPTVQTITTSTAVETDRGIIQKVVSVRHVPTTVSILARMPLAFSGPIKIAENQSPLPQDRVFLTYNYYNDIQLPSGPGTGTLNKQTTFVFPTTTSIVTPVPGGLPAIDLHRETFGFEKLILGGNASLGMRVPFAQVQGDGTIGQQDIGDISGIFNYAFFRSPTTGSGLAGGLMLTAPTGPGNYTIVGNIHPWLFQPFVGYRWINERLYVQGFSSVLTPADPRYLTAMFNDIAAGYWLYRGNPGQTIWAIIPTVEAHVTTPLNHRNVTDPITMPDFVTLTAGVHIGLANGAMLTVGTVVPVSGPRLFPIEAVAQLNYRF